MTRTLERLRSVFASIRSLNVFDPVLCLVAWSEDQYLFWEKKVCGPLLGGTIAG